MGHYILQGGFGRRLNVDHDLAVVFGHRETANQRNLDVKFGVDKSHRIEMIEPEGLQGILNCFCRNVAQ